MAQTKKKNNKKLSKSCHESKNPFKIRIFREFKSLLLRQRKILVDAEKSSIYKDFFDFFQSAFYGILRNFIVKNVVKMLSRCGVCSTRQAFSISLRHLRIASRSWPSASCIISRSFSVMRSLPSAREYLPMLSRLRRP